jgi:hypothetical protein
MEQKLREKNMFTSWSIVGKNMMRLVGAVFAAWVMIIQPAVAQDNTQSCDERDLVKAGTFKVIGKGGGFIIGARWGSGVVTLDDGVSFFISFRGAKLFDIGAAELQLEGTVYNLDRIDDFPGTYLGVGGGLAAATEALGGVSITNGKCVVLNGKPVGGDGLRASMPLGPRGVTIKIEE